MKSLLVRLVAPAWVGVISTSCAAPLSTTTAEAPPPSLLEPAELERRCQEGNQVACMNFGLRLRTGQGIPVDPGRARELLEVSCQRDVAEGCQYYARMLAAGEGGLADYPLATQLLKKACDGGDVGSCVHLGVVLSDGAAGYLPDIAGAFAAFHQVCPGKTDAEDHCAAGLQWPKATSAVHNPLPGGDPDHWRTAVKVTLLVVVNRSGSVQDVMIESLDGGKAAEGYTQQVASHCIKSIKSETFEPAQWQGEEIPFVLRRGSSFFIFGKPKRN